MRHCRRLFRVMDNGVAGIHAAVCNAAIRRTVRPLCQAKTQENAHCTRRRYTELKIPTPQPPTTPSQDTVPVVVRHVLRHITMYVPTVSNFAVNGMCQATSRLPQPLHWLDILMMCGQMQPCDSAGAYNFRRVRWALIADAANKRSSENEDCLTFQ